MLKPLPLRRLTPRWLLLLSVLLVGSASREVRAAERPDPNLLKVTSYNVQFLPGPGEAFNQRGNNAYRAQTIGEKLAAFDIVGLNEAFQDVHREKLLDQLKSAWGSDYQAVAGPAPKEKGRYNGGLVIATRLPILASHETIYSKISLPKDYGFLADGFASKGVLHARVALPARGESERKEGGPFVDVFVTHMESKSKEIREFQYTELSAFMKQYADPAAPILLLGDLNTRGNQKYRDDSSAQYHKLMAELARVRPASPLIDLWTVLGQGAEGTGDQTSSDGGSRIDYVFLSNPAGCPAVLEPLSIRVNRYLDPKVVALSDHSAVEADFRRAAPGR